MRNIYDVIFNHETKDINSESGEKTRPTYKAKFNEEGTYELVEDGVINSYDDIQSYLEGCDLNLIIQKYNMTGDQSLLNVRQGFFDDVTALPKNYAELQNILIQADSDFNALPLEIKEEFGNSPAQFYSSIGTEHWDNAMSKYIEHWDKTMSKFIKKDDPIIEEVIKDE